MAKEKKLSDYMWLCPLCRVYYNKNTDAKKNHIKDEIEEIKKVLHYLENELK